MNELIRLAHEFLQNFCLGNHQNQELLHKRIDLFLTHEVGPLVYLVDHTNRLRRTICDDSLGMWAPVEWSQVDR